MTSPNPVILVTGTSRGLGYEISRILLTMHIPISLITVSRSHSPSGTVALPDHTIHSHTHIQQDLSAPGGPAAAVARAISTYGRLDGIVANHGILDPVQRIAEKGVEEGEQGAGVDGREEIAEEGGEPVRGVGGEGVRADGLGQWRTAWDVNFFSVVELCRSAVPYLRATSGRIVFISSGASQTGYSGWGCYSATKAALNSLCRTLAVEEPLITTISLRPGVMDTEMQRDIRERHRMAMGAGHERFMELHRSGRLLRPAIPGAVVANLVVNGAKELSGGYFSWDSPEMKDYQGPAN